MTSFVQIILFVLALHRLNIASAKPFGEVLLKNNFDIAFKPLPFKPIAFIKEKWSPFGKFGFKHGIVKRDLDKIKPLENVVVPIEKDLTRLPAAVYEVEEPGVLPMPHIGVLQAPPLFPVGPIPAPPPPPVVITPPPKFKEIPPVNGLQTNIYRDELINTYLKYIERPFPEDKVLPPFGNSIIPEKPKIDVPPVPVEKEENPIVRGSRLALYFGNILLDALAQFIGSPKAEQPVII